MEKIDSTISISLPALMFYVPLFREFVADTLMRVGFSEQFAYRTEVIVDELCSNAIQYGSHSTSARIDLRLSWDDDQIDLSITDEGGSEENISALREAIEAPQRETSDDQALEDSLGLEIVKMLSESVDIKVQDNNITSVRIVRNREA
jgi:anti-sigma regulatory factor (Ser/Thr protein kinase)